MAAVAAGVIPIPAKTDELKDALSHFDRYMNSVMLSEEELKQTDVHHTGLESYAFVTA